MKTIKIGNGEATFVADQANTLYTMAAGKTITSASGGGIDAYGKVKGREFDIDGTVDAFGVGISFGSGLGTGAAYGTTLDVGESGHVSGSYGIIASGRDNVLRNAGEIVGSQYGVSFSSGTLTLVNTGEISGMVGIVASLGAEAITLKNTGIISGIDYAIYGGYVGDGSDRIVNSGEINGDVELSAGDDVFIFKSGIVNGTVNGGADDDIHVIKRAGLIIAEKENEGTDTVRASMSYELGAHIEELRLAGNGDIDGTGNGDANELYGNSGRNALNGGLASDILDGGKGNDVLTGGLDGDTFEFHRGSGRDIVADFEIGIDEIELGDLTGAKNFNDMMKNHTVEKGDDVWITYGQDTVVLKNIDKIDLLAGDFVFG